MLVALIRRCGGYPVAHIREVLKSRVLVIKVFIRDLGTVAPNVCLDDSIIEREPHPITGRAHRASVDDLDVVALRFQACGAVQDLVERVRACVPIERHGTPVIQSDVIETVVVFF